MEAFVFSRSRCKISTPLGILALLTFLTSTNALAADIAVTQQHEIVPRANTTKPFLLRVMPLGASITVGYRSSDGNGYRKALREQLRYAGWEVDMVGGLANGTMKDNQNEGHFGDTIDHIAEAAVNSTRLQPNVILINAGTNDCIQNVDINDADTRLDALITDLFSSIPNSTIILSTLLPNDFASTAVHRVSQEYRNLVARRRNAGDRIVLAEMSYFITDGELVDGTHPSDHGYRQMASVWWAAIQTAEEEGKLDAPNGVASAVLKDLVGRNGTAGSEGRGLDDGPIEDPNLPVYRAPGQPGGSGGGEGGAVALGVGGVMVWTVFVGWVVGELI
ncbi:SGNH hydrolase-type esterase domain-containing protein [Aspergillus multicolor]|uniref:SGNH/GDSL hydrolase family protein n=1 Tax=Aspergillus multicolor TaxID=41759 RepID=UPI003CCD303A